MDPTITAKLLKHVEADREKKVPEGEKIKIDAGYQKLLEDNDLPLLSKGDRIEFYIKSGRKERKKVKLGREKYIPALFEKKEPKMKDLIEE